MKPTYISKDTSLSLKGLALFFMVFLHLFNQGALVENCFNLFDVQGQPLVNFLSHGCGPVGLYLFVSGYGLYYLHNRRRGGGKKRLLKLYIVYWLTLLCFVGIGCFLKPEVYPGTWKSVLCNVTGFHTTYYEEAWFLFPYVLLSLTCGWVFKAIERVDVRIVLPVVFFLNYVAMFLVSRYFSVYFASHWAIYQVVLYFDCLFAFLLGALFCKYSVRDVKWRWMDWLTQHQAFLVTALIVLFLVNCFIHSAAFSPFYLPVFIFLFIHINWSKQIVKCLHFLGRYSTVVWLVHTWFCYYLFKDFIYGFHYPIIILIVEIALSIAAGFIIQQITKKVYSLLRL